MNLVLLGSPFTEKESEGPRGSLLKKEHLVSGRDGIQVPFFLNREPVGKE